MALIECYSFAYSKAEQGCGLVARGEVKNNSGRNYSAVAVRIILFAKNTPLVSAVTVVNGLPNGSSRGFEKRFEEIDYGKVGSLITRYDVFVESAY